MFRRQSGNSDSNDASAYSRRSAVADSLWNAQDRLRSGLPAATKRFADIAAWPLERATYAVRTRLIWPAEDRAEKMGRPARVLASAAVALLAVGAGVSGLIWAAPDRPDSGAGATAVAKASGPPAVVKAAPEQPPEPTLQGATPVFKPTRQELAAAEVDPAKAIVKSSPTGAPASSGATESSSAQPSSTASSAAASEKLPSVDGPPAGPQAISVAGDFATAFVRYETGASDPAVRRAFGETATPALAKALLRRPPRLPANVKVPKAKVVNVVPAPSSGGIYPVSVSLLRVGLTSELRLEMEKLKGDGWRVTNVLG
jgi:hypothetical protein